VIIILSADLFPALAWGRSLKAATNVPQPSYSTPDIDGCGGRTPRTATGTRRNRPRGWRGLLDPKMLWKSLPDAFRKLDPRCRSTTPVMFVVESGRC